MNLHLKAKKLNVRHLFPCTVLAAVLVIAGCGTVTPEKITPAEVGDRVRTDQERIYRAQEPLRGPVTFSIALARALKYNLDYRLKLMESSLSRNLLDVANMDLMPRLVVEAGYTSRNNDSGGTSIGIEDRIVSLRPSTSEERSHYYDRRHAVLERAGFRHRLLPRQAGGRRIQHRRGTPPQDPAQHRAGRAQRLLARP